MDVLIIDPLLGISFLEHFEIPFRAPVSVIVIVFLPLGQLILIFHEVGILFIHREVG